MHIGDAAIVGRGRKSPITNPVGEGVLGTGYSLGFGGEAGIDGDGGVLGLDLVAWYWPAFMHSGNSVEGTGVANWRGGGKTSIVAWR